MFCKNRNIVRTIRVEMNSSTGECVTQYTKAGKDRLVGSGRHFSSCLSFLENIQQNLEAANWKCRDVSRSKITKLEMVSE